MTGFSCIVLAAGNGLRFGGQKQFFHWQGKPLWQYAADTCRRVTGQVIVVGVDCPGGSSRQESVRNGLQHVEHDRVVIVEAARPLVSSEQILKIAKEPYPSVSYAVHPTDTVFYKGIVLDRRESYCLQVPQAFDTIKLRAAHQRTMMQNANDDTILMSECYGIEPRLLTGGFNLFKVTYPWDLDVLEVLQRRM